MQVGTDHEPSLLYKHHVKEKPKLSSVAVKACILIKSAVMKAGKPLAVRALYIVELLYTSEVVQNHNPNFRNYNLP